MERLQADSIPVEALVNPLRGIAADSAYVASAMRQIPGRVLAVAHSYGGAVITNAATTADNVVGLVYVAAFAPDEGETLMDIEGRTRDSVLLSALRPTEYPTGTGSGSAVELSIDPASFREAFAADLPEQDAAVMSATQRPIAESSFGEKSGPPAWKRLPSWAVVATGDKTVGTDVVRSSAYQTGRTRQLTNARSRSRTPGQPSATAVTTTAATVGPNGSSGRLCGLRATSGHTPHDTTRVTTANQTYWRR